MVKLAGSLVNLRNVFAVELRHSDQETPRDYQIIITKNSGQEKILHYGFDFKVPQGRNHWNYVNQQNEILRSADYAIIREKMMPSD